MRLFRESIKVAVTWLPKAKREWNNFKAALDAHKPLPSRVTKALEKHFGWTNTDRNNHSLPPIPLIIEKLELSLREGLTAKFHSEREQSPRSMPGKVRWTKARPWQNEDGGPDGLILFPDFFSSFNPSGTRMGLRDTKTRATTVLHETLHNMERTGEFDWHDVAEEDEPKDRGSVLKYISNPASYAAFIRDLAQ